MNIELQKTQERTKCPNKIKQFWEFLEIKNPNVETHPQDKLSPWKSCVNFQTKVFCSFI